MIRVPTATSTVEGHPGSGEKFSENFQPVICVLLAALTGAALASLTSIIPEKNREPRVIKPCWPVPCCTTKTMECANRDR